MGADLGHERPAQRFSSILLEETASRGSTSVRARESPSRIIILKNDAQ